VAIKVLGVLFNRRSEPRTKASQLFYLDDCTLAREVYCLDRTVRD